MKETVKVTTKGSEIYLPITSRLAHLKVNKTMIAALKDIPFDKVMSCEWVIITHKIDQYKFQKNDCFKYSKQLKLIKCGGSVGYKLNGKFRSLTWIKANRKPTIEVMVRNVEYYPF
jgi:hypothetical protein